LRLAIANDIIIKTTKRQYRYRTRFQVDAMNENECAKITQQQNINAGERGSSAVSSGGSNEKESSSPVQTKGKIEIPQQRTLMLANEKVLQSAVVEATKSKSSSPVQRKKKLYR